VIRGGRENYGLVLGLLALLLMLVVRYTFLYGLHIMYARGLMFMMLVVGIIAGAGLGVLRRLDVPGLAGIRQKYPLIIRATGLLLSLAVIGVTLTVTLPDRRDAVYYHMIDEQDYEAFSWIEENLGEEYDRALLDPWKGTAFTAVTGKMVYTKIHAYPTPKDQEVYDFLENGCRDTAFLRQNGISIVYHRGECANPDLVEVRDDVYLLKE